MISHHVNECKDDIEESDHRVCNRQIHLQTPGKKKLFMRKLITRKLDTDQEIIGNVTHPPVRDDDPNYYHVSDGAY